MKNVRVNSRHFAMIGHRLFKRKTGGLLRRWFVGANGMLSKWLVEVFEVEMPSILAVCHDNECGGHFSGQSTRDKIHKACNFWPTLFKDAHRCVKRCDGCQRYARNNLYMDLIQGGRGQGKK